MSAYVVDRNHIRFLIEAARHVARRNHHPTFRWYHNGWLELECQTHFNCDETANGRGQMLWDECRTSVAYRYGEEDDLPRPTKGSLVYQHVDAVGAFSAAVPEILKAIDCYEYQSCEHPGWPSSNAHAFIQALRSEAWRLLEGYEEAPWGAPEVT